jgi:8-oxo-dGTP pyrophosphatase MutT (NUDIX family)
MPGMPKTQGVPGTVTVVHATDAPPPRWDASLFLAGPTPRSADVPSWRPAAVDLIRRHWAGPGDLVVFVPESSTGAFTADYDDQIGWELRWLSAADQVLFWVPRDLATLPGLTTNDEWGWLKDSGRAVFGSPPDAAKVRYQREYARNHGIPLADTLDAAVRAALGRIGTGAPRADGERHVPLLVWSAPEFRHWYAAQRAAGNTLCDAGVVWTLRVSGALVYWAVRVSVAIAAEDGRIKDNEVVVGRPDISAVVLYRRGATVRDTQLVLVREFRSPGCAPDGYVHEFPGGSGAFADPAQTAHAELAEETGLALAPERLRAHGVRQLAATMSVHRGHVFSAEVTADELARLAAASGPHGSGDTERTWVETTTYGELLDGGRADWATMGMAAQVLADVDGR